MWSTITGCFPVAPLQKGLVYFNNFTGTLGDLVNFISGELFPHFVSKLKCREMKFLKLKISVIVRCVQHFKLSWRRRYYTNWFLSQYNVKVPIKLCYGMLKSEIVTRSFLTKTRLYALVVTPLCRWLFMSLWTVSNLTNKSHSSILIIRFPCDLAIGYTH